MLICAQLGLNIQREKHICVHAVVGAEMIEQTLHIYKPDSSLMFFSSSSTPRPQREMNGFTKWCEIDRFL